MCGRIQHSRKGTEFACECGWRLDLHINASLNLLHTAVSKEMVGGLRFDPGALQRDVMMILYDPGKGARSEPNGASESKGAVLEDHHPKIYRTRRGRRAYIRHGSSEPGC